MSASVLVVDDEKTICETLAWCLQQEGHRVRAAGTGEEAVRLMESEEFDLIISDISLPGMSGHDVLRKARVLNPRAVEILITAYATVESAAGALREGASDYILKPYKLDELKFRVQHLLQHRTRYLESALLRRSVEHAVSDGSLLGDSLAMRGVRSQVARIGPTPSNVLITGESGTGKELVARAIHRASPRQEQAFVAINCGAIPDALLESHLFGHVRGAFTDAVRASSGLFAAADRGTIFLDEIADLPLPLQVKLLRVLEEKAVWALGSTQPVRIDVRFVASTNRDLPTEVEGGRFREDLFYRLNVVHIVLPPLRERREDIPLLVEHFIHALNSKLSTRYLGVEPEALNVLMNHRWKGNVRELEHVLESAMILSEGETISARDLPSCLASANGETTKTQALREVTGHVEREHIVAVLAQARFDKKEAARRLGISLASLYRKINEFAI